MTPDTVGRLAAQLEAQLRYEQPEAVIYVVVRDGRLVAHIDPGGRVVPVPRAFCGLPVDRRPLEAV